MANTNVHNYLMQNRHRNHTPGVPGVFHYTTLLAWSTVHVNQTESVIKIHLTLEKTRTTENLAVCYHCCQLLSRRHGQEYTAQQTLLTLPLWSQTHGATCPVLAKETCGSGSCPLGGEAFKRRCAISMCLPPDPRASTGMAVIGWEGSVMPSYQTEGSGPTRARSRLWLC